MYICSLNLRLLTGSQTGLTYMICLIKIVNAVNQLSEQLIN